MSSEVAARSRIAPLMAAGFVAFGLSFGCRNRTMGKHALTCAPCGSAAVPAASSAPPAAEPEEVGLECFGRYAKPRLSHADIQQFVDEGLSRCFANADPVKLLRQAPHHPTFLGIDSRNGKLLEVYYHCSDICPGYGGVNIRYAEVAMEDCCAVGGWALHDPAWGGYLGCAPPESEPTFAFSRVPGGAKEPAKQNPCDPSQVIFADGTSVKDPGITCKLLPPERGKFRLLSCASTVQRNGMPMHRAWTLVVGPRPERGARPSVH